MRKVHSKVKEMLFTNRTHLQVGVGSLSHLRSRCKNYLPSYTSDLHVFRCKITSMLKEYPTSLLEEMFIDIINKVLSKQTYKFSPSAFGLFEGIAKRVKLKFKLDYMLGKMLFLLLFLNFIYLFIYLIYIYVYIYIINLSTT